MATKDNSLGGYLQYGVWTASAGGYLGSHSVANPASSSSPSALWQFVVSAGTYDIWATWVNSASNASNATYSIFDGFTQLGAPQANQQLVPTDGQYGGVLWAKLVTFTITNGRVTVALSATGANGDVVADGVLMVPSSAPAAAALPAFVGAAQVSSITIAPLGPMAATGQTQVSPAPSPRVASAASVPVSNPVAATVPVSSLPVNDANNAAMGAVASKAEHARPLIATELATRKAKAGEQREKAREALIDRLAQERVSRAAAFFEAPLANMIDPQDSRAKATPRVFRRNLAERRRVPET